MRRQFTNRLLDLVEEGAFDKDALINELVNWMTEDDVRDLVSSENWGGFEDLQDEDERPMSHVDYMDARSR